jgi:hypothetical protein
MIEVIESFNSDGTVSAETVGGKQVVRITERPFRWLRDYYNPSCSTNYRAGRARWKHYRIPHGFIVKHARGETFVRKYSDAIRIAIHHAAR